MIRFLDFKNGFVWLLKNHFPLNEPKNWDPVLQHSSLYLQLLNPAGELLLYFPLNTLFRFRNIHVIIEWKVSKFRLRTRLKVNISSSRGQSSHPRVYVTGGKGKTVLQNSSPHSFLLELWLPWDEEEAAAQATAAGAALSEILWLQTKFYSARWRQSLLTFVKKLCKPYDTASKRLLLMLLRVEGKLCCIGMGWWTGSMLHI